jgi:hypothetical protein
MPRPEADTFLPCDVRDITTSNEGPIFTAPGKMPHSLACPVYRPVRPYTRHNPDESSAAPNDISAPVAR